MSTNMSRSTQVYHTLTPNFHLPLTYTGMPRVQQFPLPPELIHRIMNHLVDSKHALKTCALVSRAFVPYAREKLFLGKLELSFNRVESFLSLCDDSNSTFPAALTRVKEFMFQHCCYGCFPSEIMPEDSKALSRLLTWRRQGPEGKEEAMVDMLVNVKVLSIDRVGWWTLEDRARDALLAGFQNVVEIRLWALRFEQAEDFSSLISSFPRLEDIQLQSLRLMPYVKPPPMQESASDHDKLPLTRTTPSLRSIVEYGILPAELIDVFAPLSHTLCALHCTLDLSEPSRMASINRLLVSAGPALENVSLVIYRSNALLEGGDESAIAAFCAQTSFAVNTRIRELHFPSLRQQYLLPLLKSIANARSRSDSCSSSPSLEVLEITDLANLSLNWDELDGLLASHWYFSSLKEIRCTIRTHFFKEDVVRQTEGRYLRPDEGSAAELQMAKTVQEFIARMPRCATKEILKVKEVYTYIDPSWINAVVARFAQAQQGQQPQDVRRGVRNRLRNIMRKVVRAMKRVRGRRFALSVELE